MNAHRSFLLAATIALAATMLTATESSVSNKTTAPEKPALLRRGDYLVNQVGLCIDCHSPRDERGEFLAGRHLLGAPVAVTPTVPMPAWAPAAPPIAGLPAGWSEEAMLRFLTTGERPFNLPPARPPMPPYRFNREDAEAVIAYLRSVAPSAKP